MDSILDSSLWNRWPLALFVILAYLFWRFVYRPFQDHVDGRRVEISRWSHEELEYRCGLVLAAVYDRLRTEMDKYTPRESVLTEVEKADDNISWDALDLDAVVARLRGFGMLDFPLGKEGNTVTDRLLLTDKGARKVEYSMGHVSDDPDPRVSFNFGNNVQFMWESPGGTQHQNIEDMGVPPEIIEQCLSVIEDLSLALRSGDLPVRNSGEALEVVAEVKGVLADPLVSRRRARTALTALLGIVGGGASTAMSGELSERLSWLLDQIAKAM